MSNDEAYKNFLQYLFSQYVEHNLVLVRARFPAYKRDDSFLGLPPLLTEKGRLVQDRIADTLQRLKRSAYITRYVHLYCNTEGEIYETFTPRRIVLFMDDVSRAVDFHNEIYEAMGFKEALDAYLPYIVADIEAEDLPQTDLEILEEMGVPDPKVEIQGIVYILRQRAHESESLLRKSPVSQHLHSLRDNLCSEVRKLAGPNGGLPKAPKVPKKSRRWFKGIGRIITGTSISIADIGLAIGAFTFPVSPETQTWGSLISIATGVGQTLEGIGELTGE